MDNLKEKSGKAMIDSSESKNTSTSQYGRTWRRRNKKRRIRKQGIYSYAVDANPVLVKLNQWLRSKGFRLSSGSRLKPALFPNIGRGLMTTVGVNAGEVLVSIPKQALVTCCGVLEDVELQRFFKVPQKFRAIEILTIFLLYHKYSGDSSEWKPYLDSLPKTYTVPAYCSFEEMDSFPEFLKSRIDEQVEDVDQCFASLQKIVLKNSKYKQIFSSLCVDDVKWGWFTVNTRAVYLKEKHPVPFISDEDIYALAPFLDLLNHSCSAQVTTGMNESNDCYEIVTQVPFGRYEQVFINYGPHDNVKLYVEYGFNTSLEMNTFSALLASCLLLGVASQDVEEITERRNITQELNINNGIDWGDWGPAEFCEEGSFVHGFEVMFQPSGALDETALNAVKLYCADDFHYDTGYITSTIGSSGEWQGMRVCHQGFLTGLRAEVLEPQGVLKDDVAVENIDMQCDYDGEILAGVLDLPKFTPGTWSTWDHCETGSSVCGLQVRFEAVSVGDDSATTDLVMYCCLHE